ncbi:hypothetical protein DL240_08695 [Lujinxingia litoralis]|uniref:TRAM domain-containing protein n=1 Tax=Lujinxingia litoralis TaxID=2211119 RepID=A0A328C628_9DELT|nr:TRAM domain-containing protein [Lujinxingia litoralis]RAL22959.1 hypothetical protein DL240_08695 [Lujinxingia litoralis]
MARARYQGMNIREIAQGGDGVAELPDGRVCFVPGALPGDVVEVELTRDKKRWARARVLELETPSPWRVKPECSYAERGCGGCQFWHVEPAQELRWKAQAAFEAMQRIAGAPLPEPGLHPAPAPRGYRTRVSFHQRRSREGRVELGFFKTESHRVIPVERCAVAIPLLNEVLESWRAPLALLGEAEILVESAGAGEAVISATLTGAEAPTAAALDAIEKRVQEGGALRGLQIEGSRGERWQFGRPEIDADQILARPAAERAMAPGQFRQSNAGVNQQLVTRASELLHEVGARRVLELFCGAGNFSFALDGQVEALHGLEGSREAIADARAMADAAGLETLSFEGADLFDERVYQALEPGAFDAVLLDPPRDGAQAAATWLAAPGHTIRSVVYVACDPACMARDLGTLVGGGWRVEGLEFFDLFPRTRHIETIAWLRR